MVDGEDFSFEEGSQVRSLTLVNSKDFGLICQNNGVALAEMEQLLEYPAFEMLIGHPRRDIQQLVGSMNLDIKKRPWLERYMPDNTEINKGLE